MGTCTFTFDPATEAGPDRPGELDGEWSCPHEAHPEGDRCVLHLSSERRDELGVDSVDVTERFMELFEAEDREHKRAVGATLPTIHLEYRKLSGQNRYPVDLRYAEIEALEVDHSTVETRLDLRGGTVGTLDLTESEFEKRLYLSGGRIEEAATAPDVRFDEEVEFGGVEFGGPVEFPDATFEDELDLREAVFEDEADFEMATFEATALLDDVVFEGLADFDEARFREDVAFDDTEYHDVADFRGVEFSGGSNFLEDDVDFEFATFHGPARFEEAVIADADFHEAVFEAEADFEGATFREDLCFDDAVFHGLADFDEGRFGEDASFKRTEYHGTADFRGVEFDGGANVLEDDADFEESVFHGPARFGAAEFTFADFHETVFRDEADFEGATFSGDLNFDDAVFHELADFDEGRFEEDASFKRTEYHGTADFRGVEFAGGANVLEDDTDFEESVFHGPARFGEAEFAHCDFHDAVFEAEAAFQEAAFDEDVDFRGVQFRALADFDEARFYADGDFGGATFEDEAEFRGVEFVGEARHMEDNARFEDVTFSGHVHFDDAVFTAANFRGITLGDTVDFQNAVFRDRVDVSATSSGETTYVNMTDADLEAGSISQPADHWVRYDMTRARIGEVTLSRTEGSSQELFDYFRFLETDFDGFDFSAHRDYLDRNNWVLHVFEEAGADYEFDLAATPSTVETTYLYAYNNAKSMGDNDAAIEFAIHQAQFRRKKNVEYVRDSTLSTGYRLGKLGDVIGNSLWYATCGYGYRLWRIVAVSAFVIVTWAVLYAMPFTELTEEASVESLGALFSWDGAVAISHYLYYSLVTFTTVGYGDINPLNAAARVLATAEGVLGVLLAALVVFVLGRRVAV